MEFVKLKPINRICPYCGNGNYMRIISGKNVGKLNVKCINCNSYYNYDELLKRDNSKPLNGADGRTMDDLISRAAARDVINTWGRHGNGDVRMDLLHKDLNAIPAVDAIPVEWLNKQCEMADDRGDMEMTDAISWLIQTWQEEQEAR